MSTTIFTNRNVKIASDLCRGDSSLFDQKDDDYKNLLLSYLQDCSTGTFREAITSYICGYEWLFKKRGFDAYNQNTNTFIEIKPESLNGGATKKLFTGGRPFNDLTLEKLNEYNKMDFNVVTSAFYEKDLIYILEFPFNCLSKRLENHLLTSKAKRSTPSFSYKDYINCNNLKVHYVNYEMIIKHNCLSDKFYKALNNITEPKITLFDFIKNA